MWEAIVRVRSFPTQIEADLHKYYRLDIADWHRGTVKDGVPVVSSRKLLVLVDGLPEDSEYRTAFERDGNWPVWMQMLKLAANEVSLHRASLYAGGDNAYGATIFLDPSEQQQRIDDAIAEQEFHKEATATLYGNLGWS